MSVGNVFARKRFPWKLTFDSRQQQTTVVLLLIVDSCQGKGKCVKCCDYLKNNLYLRDIRD